MRGLMIGWAGVLFSATSAAQTPEGQPRTAEQFIETAREIYSVPEPEAEPCSAPVGNEIVVCRQVDRVPDQRLPSPTDRARTARQMPPDPIPEAPYVLGLPECGVEVACHRMGGQCDYRNGAGRRVRLDLPGSFPSIQDRQAHVH